MKIRIVLAAAVAAALMAAPGAFAEGKTEKGAAAPAEKAKPTKLSFLVSNTFPQEGMKAIAAEALARWNIEVGFEVRPGGAEGENIVKTRLVAGDMADLVYFNSGSLFQQLNPTKNFVDLTDEPFMKNVMDSYKGTVSANGRVFMVPAQSINAGAWLYNRKVYAELGLKPPRTWAELMANCEKIKASGKTAVIATYNKDWTSQLIVLADFYNVLAASPSFPADFTAHKTGFATNPAALRGFEKMREVHDRGFMNANPMTTTYEDGLKMLADGSGAHFPILTQALGNLRKLAPDKMDDIGLFAQPGESADKYGLTVWMPQGVGIYKGSKNIEAAKKFLSLLASPEGMALHMAAQKPEGPFAIKGVTLPADMLQAVKDMLPFMEDGKNAGALEFYSPVKGPNLPQICIQTGIALKSPLESAKEYDKDVEKQAKQLGLPGW